MRQTTKQLDSEDTVRSDVLSSFVSKLNSCVKYSDSCIFAFIVLNAARIGPYYNTTPKSLFLSVNILLG